MKKRLGANCFGVLGAAGQAYSAYKCYRTEGREGSRQEVEGAAGEEFPVGASEGVAARCDVYLAKYAPDR